MLVPLQLRAKSGAAFNSLCIGLGVSVLELGWFFVKITSVRLSNESTDVETTTSSGAVTSPVRHFSSASESSDTGNAFNLQALQFQEQEIARRNAIRREEEEVGCTRASPLQP